MGKELPRESGWSRGEKLLVGGEHEWDFETALPVKIMKEMQTEFGDYSGVTIDSVFAEFNLRVKELAGVKDVVTEHSLVKFSIDDVTKRTLLASALGGVSKNSEFDSLKRERLGFGLFASEKIQNRFADALKVQFLKNGTKLATCEPFVTLFTNKSQIMKFVDDCQNTDQKCQISIIFDTENTDVPRSAWNAIKNSSNISINAFELPMINTVGLQSPIDLTTCHKWMILERFVNKTPKDDFLWIEPSDLHNDETFNCTFNNLSKSIVSASLIDKNNVLTSDALSICYKMVCTWSRFCQTLDIAELRQYLALSRRMIFHTAQAVTDQPDSPATLNLRLLTHKLIKDVININ